MIEHITKYMARWYFRSAYEPVPIGAGMVGQYPPECHLNTVPWIAVHEPLCPSTALQMMAAHYGIDKPRRYFDFLMGFTYGASYRDDFGFITIGTDPETGLRTAAPILGLVRRYYVTDDATLFLSALRSKLSQGDPIRVPLDMGALYGQSKPLPHNEVLVGYDANGFYYYEPVGRLPAPSRPGQLAPGERGFYTADARLLLAVSSESRLFGYPWRYPFVVFERGPRCNDLAPVWRQNGQALIGGKRWGQVWGAAAIEHQAAEIERGGEQFNFASLALALEIGAVTRPDNATYLREAFGERPGLLQAADRFDEAGQAYAAAQGAVAGGVATRAAARRVADHLRRAAAAECAAGQQFLAQIAGPTAGRRAYVSGTARG